MQPSAPPPSDDDSYVLPCAEALLAGSLALMTGHAQSDCARQRFLMARKIRSNLFFLAQHPGINATFRTVLQRMHDHWDQLVQTRPVEPPASRAESSELLPETRLWHPPAERLQ